MTTVRTPELSENCGLQSIVVRLPTTAIEIAVGVHSTVHKNGLKGTLTGLRFFLVHRQLVDWRVWVVREVRMSTVDWERQFAADVEAPVQI